MYCMFRRRRSISRVRESSPMVRLLVRRIWLKGSCLVSRADGRCLNPPSSAARSESAKRAPLTSESRRAAPLHIAERRAVHVVRSNSISHRLLTAQIDREHVESHVAASDCALASHETCAASSALESVQQCRRILRRR